MVHIRSLDDLDWNLKMLNLEDDIDLLGSISGLGCVSFKWNGFLLWPHVNEYMDVNIAGFSSVECCFELWPCIPVIPMIRYQWIMPIHCNPRIRSGNQSNPCQIMATSHDLTPKGSLVREIILFEGHVGEWTIIVWPQICLSLYLYIYIYIYLCIYLYILNTYIICIYFCVQP